VNAIEVISNDQILLTMRNTWASYLIDAASGGLVWTLGGKASTFSLPANARFAWQHDTRLLPNGEVTLFDDNCCKLLPGGKFAKPGGPSRGLVLKLDTTSHKASLVASYSHSPHLFTAFLGSMQLLPNRNAVVGWGSQPYFSEYSSSGKQLLDAGFPGKDQSYRALWTPNWVGTPFYPPSGAVRTSRGIATVYASWNGATEVTRWEVLGGSSASRLRRLAVKPRAGFETPIVIGKGKYKMLEVQALDAHGHVLGTSSRF
jgi:hypothetical protein